MRADRCSRPGADGGGPVCAALCLSRWIGARGEIEIVLGNGRRLIVGAGIDAAALARVVAVLERA